MGISSDAPPSVRGRRPARRLLSALAVACLITLAACGGGSGSEAIGEGQDIEAPQGGDPARVLEQASNAKVGDEPLKLGLVSVLEGSSFASNGKQVVAGAEFAVKQINANGGVNGTPIELVEKDTRGDIPSTTNIIRELATKEQVLGVVGPILSGECEAACPVADSLGLPVLAPGVGKPGVVQKAGPHIFHLVAEDCQHTTASLTSLIKSRGLQSISIIKDEKDPVSQYMGDQCFPALLDSIGLKPASVETFTTGDTNFSAQVTDLESEDPDAVILAAGPSDAARIAIEMNREDFNPQLLGSGGLQSAGGDFLDAGGDAVEGTIMAAQFDPRPQDEDPATLIKTFEDETGDDVTLNSAYAYDAVYILVDMIEQMGVENGSGTLKDDREKIKDGLASKVKDWIGMGGSTTLAKDGGVQRPAQIATVKDGEMKISVPE